MSGIGTGVSLRRDHAIAKVIGVPIVKGWRKQLVNVVLTDDQSKAVRAIVNKLNCDSRTRRLEKVVLKGSCLFELHPEFEVVGELYYLLRKAGLEAKLEVCVPSDLHTSGFMRIDIGVFHQGRLVHAIECKRDGKWMGKGTIQARAYRELNERFGIEIHFANHGDHFTPIVEACRVAPEV